MAGGKPPHKNIQPQIGSVLRIHGRRPCARPEGVQVGLLTWLRELPRVRVARPVLRMRLTGLSIRIILACRNSRRLNVPRVRLAFFGAAGAGLPETPVRKAGEPPQERYFPGERGSGRPWDAQDKPFRVDKESALVPAMGHTEPDRREAGSER